MCGKWEACFMSYLEESGRSARTVQGYLQDVRQFASWFFDVNAQEFDPGTITGVDLRAWRERSLNEVSAATWNRRRISLSVFCEFAVSQNWLSYNPFSGVERAEQVELPPRWLTRGDLLRIMRQVELSVNGASTAAWRSQALRDQAIVMLMVLAGLREGEVCALDVTDVEIKERSGRVTIRRGKGDKRRQVPLNAEVRRALQAWLDDSGRVAGPLFVSKHRSRLGGRSIQRMVSELSRRAGVECTPHSLRHTFAKRLLDEQTPLTVVSKLLGHSRLETTARYVQPGWWDYEQAVARL